MRISDWSSDVCSSDLRRVPLPRLDVSLDRLLQRIHQIGSLPAKEIAVSLAAEVAIACHGLIDRLVQPLIRADALWRKQQKFRQHRPKPGFVHRSGAVGIDLERGSEEHTLELKSIMRIL